MNWTRLRTLGLALGVAASIAVSVAAATGIASAASGTTTVSATYAPPPPPLPGPGPRGGPGRGPLGALGPGGPERGPGLVGAIASVASGSFTLTARGTTYMVDLGSSTSYDVAPGLAASASDLAAGEHVAVLGSTSGRTVTATTVYIQLSQYRGTVTAVGGDALSIQQPSGRTGTMDVSGTPEVSVGQQVQGFGTWRGDTLTAKAWRVLPDHVGGTVASVSGDSAKVTEPGGSIVTVTWTSSTTFGAGPNRSASASAVVAGAHIQAQGQLSGGVLAATRIDVMPAPPAPPASPASPAPPVPPASGQRSAGT